MPLPRITRKRQFVQFFLIATALLLPFVTISGNPFLRMDIAKMTLFLAGVPLRIDQFYLVLLVTLLSVVSFLLLTTVLGRVWCGWLCPQTVLNDLLDSVIRRFHKKTPPFFVRLIEHLAALSIATLIAIDLFCWFIPLDKVFTDIRHFSEHPAIITTLLMLSLFNYINLILVKRSFCRSYCPYGRLQIALMDAGTLNLSFLEEVQDRCLRCNACVRTCPMGIDIREGFQIECINCGRCIDACRTVMEKKPGGTGLIDYRFGTIKGTRFRLGNTTTALLILTLLLSAGLAWGLISRNQSAFALQRVATAEPRRLADGTLAQPWRAIIGNRSESAQVYSIRIAGELPNGVELLGQVRDIKVAPNQHQEVIFMIHVTNSRHPEKIQLQLFSGEQLTATVPVSP